jgi:hypothetical protein
MKVVITQAYIEPGVRFPFSHVMQGWLERELSALASPSPSFVKKYGPGYNLVIYMSAKRGLTESEIKGPAVFKKMMDVEYTLFLPFDRIVEQGDMYRAALGRVCDGVRSIFARAGIDAPRFDASKQAQIIEQICAAPDMLDGPWPTPSVNPLH